MLTLLLLACTGDSPTDTNKTPDETGTTTESGTTTTTTGGVDYWTKYKVETDSSLRGVYSSGSGVYIVATRGQMWTGSSTEAWAPVTVTTNSPDFNNLWGAGADETLELAIAADDGWVYTYSAGAWTEHSIGDGDNRAVSGTSVNDLYVVGDNGIYHFDGVSWSQEATASVGLNAVWAGTDSVWVAGDEGEVMRRTDGVWAASETNKSANFYAIAGSGASDMWTFGDQGVVMRWDGASWKQSTTPTTETLNGVYAATDGTMFAVGNNGTTLRWESTGWESLANDTDQNLYAVHGVSGVNAWGVGNGGLAMQYKE